MAGSTKPGWTRWLLHGWHALGSDGRWLTTEARARVQARIAQSERGHGGEIRVCIERALPWAELWRGCSARQRAEACFAQLGVWDTADRCGVLIYLLLAERRIEVVADRGIVARVSAEQWQALVADMGQALAQGQREAGLLHAIGVLDSLLRTHFPLASTQDNPNELPDAPVLR